MHRIRPISSYSLVMTPPTDPLSALLDLSHPRKQAAVDWARTHVPEPVAIDRDWWRAAAAEGFQGLTIPAEYGGNDAAAVDALLSFEGLGLGCEDNGAVFALASQVFPSQLSLVRFGTDEQKRRWLPGFADGSVIGAFAMSEPAAGSDTSSITTTATEQADGSYVLNGTKTWVTLAPVCDVAIVFATTDPSLGTWGITAFLVEADNPGFETGDVIAKMGLRTCPFSKVHLTDCVVGPDAVLGRPGAGNAIFTAAVDAERAFLYAAQLGSMERVLDRTIERSCHRTQFGEPIGSFQAVSHRIVDMKRRHETGRLLVYKAAALYDRGENLAIASALAKLEISENAVQGALDAVRLHGAEGYTDDLGLEAELRDAVGGLAYSGTSEIQKNIIARYLGVGRRVRARPPSGKQE